MSKSFFYSGTPLHFEVLDVEAVSVSGDDKAVKQYQLDQAPPVHSCDVLVAGGGMGGVAAALESSKTHSTLLTEETSWLGGQMTSQGVCALDENKYVETTGACKSYLFMRERIRDHYRHSNKLTADALADALLHPGKSWVTRLAFEPDVAVQVIDELLAPAAAAERLSIMRRLKAVAVSRQNAIQAVLFIDLDSGSFLEVQPRLVLDATELGDLLALAKIPYRTGSDSRSETGEKHAPELGDTENVQDFTYPFVLEYYPGENHVIEKPADYDNFMAAGKFSFYGYHMFEETDDQSTGVLRHLLPFWTYRRLIDKSLFQPGIYKSDIAMINWDSNDLRGKNIIDKTPEVQRQYLALAKRVSLGFLYWLQTEAPRDDGGKGYSGLKLVRNIFGTADGLSRYPYIREARRLSANTTVVEQDIVASANLGSRARRFEDSIGIGLYPVDIHGHQEVPGAAQESKPFQIPLESLITHDCSNYIAACKNIGVTHITNGAYRLHPIEWAIGTAAGTLASMQLSHKFGNIELLSNKDILQTQMLLTAAGAPIFWFDDIMLDDENFQAIQIMAATGVIACNSDDLSFRPDEDLVPGEADQAVKRLSSFCEKLSSEVHFRIRVGNQITRRELAELLFGVLKLSVFSNTGSSIGALS